MRNIFRKIAHAPDALLNESAELTKIETSHISEGGILTTTKKYWKTLGPGLITGASDDDPSGIATYSQTGAQYGPQLLWLATFSFPFMALIQEMCGRIALVTGRGLASNIRRSYSRKILFICAIFLFAANTLNIGADLGAMAKGVQLLYPHFNFTFLIVVIGIGSLLLEVFVSYRVYAKYLKWLVFVLFSYVISLFLIKLDWGSILTHTFIPSITFSKDQIYLITAILGTTISPYLFFWQTSQEVEEEILEGRTTLSKRQHVAPEELTLEIKNMQTDVWSGMFLSNFVMFAIIAVCAGTLYASGITNITSASDAALALRPLAGDSAFLLFAIGIIGTGLLAIPVLAASVSYAIAELFSWHEGLYRKFKSAHSFYGVMILAVVLGLALNFLHIDPIKALIYSAVGNGLIAPIIMVCIVHMSGSKKIMGKHASKKRTSFFGWLITGIMTIAGVMTIISFF